MKPGVTREGETMDGGTDGSRLGPYRLIQRLGEGGMGVVHLALDATGRAVAIKVLRPHIAHDVDARARLRREVETLSRVRDPRVAAVLDADIDGDRPYLVTRYVPGPPLDRVVAERGALRGEPLLRLGRGLSGALGAIHGAGVIHRDLKPGNVLVLDGEPVVIDFGIAHVADDVRLTMTGLVMGTPGYLSPELVEGADVTEATDWWGWAATLAFAASGAPPFGRGPMEVVLDRVRRGQADLSGVDPRLAPLLLAALAPCARSRPDAGEVVQALERYAEGAPGTLVMPVSSGAVTGAGHAPAATVGTPTAGTAEQPAVVTAAQPAMVTAEQPAVVTAAQPAAPAPERRAPDRWEAPAPERWESERWESERARWDAPPPEEDAEPSGEESDWQAAWEGGAGHPDPRRGRPARTGTLLALLSALIGLAVIWPVVAAAVILLWCWVARFADRSVTSLVLRRHHKGRRRGDVPLAVVTSPWHVLVAAFSAVVALLVPAAVGAACTFSTAFALVAVTGGTPRPASSLPLGVGALVGVLMAWWGPGGSALRRGTRSIVRGGVHGRSLTQAVCAVATVLGAGLGLWAWLRHGDPQWWPWTGAAPAPFSSLLNR